MWMPDFVTWSAQHQGTGRDLPNSMRPRSSGLTWEMAVAPGNDAQGSPSLGVKQHHEQAQATAA